MIKTALFSTGVSSLDSLIQEVRPGDNFVFNLSSLRWYRPFARSLLKHCLKNEISTTLVRVDGSLDGLAEASMGWVNVFDVPEMFAEPEEFKAGFRSNIRFSGKGAFYIFDNASALLRILGRDSDVREFFQVFCPLLEENESLTYWPFVGRKQSSTTMAAIRDSAHVFVNVRKGKLGVQLRVVKAEGRYSERIYMTHRLSSDAENIRLFPIPTVQRSLRKYARELELKNHELLEIKANLENAGKSCYSAQESSER